MRRPIPQEALQNFKNTSHMTHHGISINFLQAFNNKLKFFLNSTISFAEKNNSERTAVFLHWVSYYSEKIKTEDMDRTTIKFYASSTHLSCLFGRVFIVGLSRKRELGI